MANVTHNCFFLTFTFKRFSFYWLSCCIQSAFPHFLGVKPPELKQEDNVCKASFEKDLIIKKILLNLKANFFQINYIFLHTGALK